MNTETWLEKTPELIVNACDKHDGRWVPTHINSRKKISTCIKCGHEYPFVTAQPEVGL